MIYRILLILSIVTVGYSDDYILSSSGIDFTSSSISRSNTAYASCVKIVCFDRQASGTAFFHKSGCFITAAHVVDGSSPDSVFILLPNANGVPVQSMVLNTDLDLALIYPGMSITGPSLSIASDDTLEIGSQVATWGFPYGYNNLNPMLTIGYLAGLDNIDVNGQVIRRWVINAAFNSGNSGGPVININNGEVIGVVSSKVAPLPRYIEQALEALGQQTYGMQYTWYTADGDTLPMSEGQVIEDVLSYLRSQTQLVIGHAVMLDDLRAFLIDQGIQP